MAEPAESLGRKRSMDLIHEWGAVLFSPLARFLARRNVSPNMVTILGCLISIVGAVFVASGHRWAAAAAIAVGGLFDGLDGLVARLSQRTSRFGGFLDSVLDRWSDSALFVGLLIWYSGAEMRMAEILCILALASSLLVSYTRARAEGIGASSGRGLFTRFERISALLAGLVLDKVTLALWIIVVLSTATALQRIFCTWQYVKSHPEKVK